MTVTGDPSATDQSSPDLRLAPRTEVTVVKLEPGGREVARYAAVVANEPCPAPWFGVQARWIMKRVEVCGLTFEPGDSLIEYFSPEHWFNTFQVLAPRGSVRGIYGNVTYPTLVSRNENGVVITWHDLYLDVIRLPDGSIRLCDGDELRDSGLRESDPNLHRQIELTASTMLTLAQNGQFPFHIPSG